MTPSKRPAPKLLITPGEPAGVGPELTLMAAQRFGGAPLIALADPTLLSERAQSLGLKIELRILEDAQAPCIQGQGTLNILPEPLASPCSAGTLDTANASYVVNTLARAADLCMAGQFAAIVTGPVQKSVINEAGVPFSGHTEFFAERSNTPRVVMMLATEGLRVALATTHLPLRDVPNALTQQTLSEVLSILIREMQGKFGIKRPRILVAGLNPHAGEGGHLGMEEIEVISPVLARFAEASAELVGPLPADTLFTPHHLHNADAVLAMYHDQGLPVLKHLGFGKAVNITLGLPFIRTALDLAGKGSADVGSLMEAIHIAHQLAQAS